MTSGDDLNQIVGDLAKATVAEDSSIISYAGRGLKWDKAEDIKDVVDAIKRCQNMLTLKLEGNTLGVEAAKEVAKVIESHPELKRALWRDMFTGRLKSEIPQALRFLSSGLQLAGAKLVELDLSDNAFGPIGVEGIAELLKSSTCFTLQELRLNNNGLGIQGGKLLAKSLLECHKSSLGSFQLKIFICGRNRLENDGAKAIAEVFKVLGTLEEIQMPQNGIFSEGIETLANAIESNLNLKHINFNDNIFTVEGARAMAKILPNLSNLEIINLGDCLVKSEGALLLAQALSRQTKLKEINFGYNEIDQRGALALINSLRNKIFLEKLELDGNIFGENGRDAIKSALKNFGKLNVLGSLSDDEGDDDDDEEDGDDGNEQSDENQEDLHYSQDKIETSQPSVTPNIPLISSTPEEFLSSPSIGRFLGLGDKRTKLLIDHIITNSKGLNHDIQTFIKVSQFAKCDNTIIKDSALACCDDILARSFNKAEDDDSVPTLSNMILESLGLIKSEDKNYKPPSDLSGSLLALEHCVRQPYFSKSTKEILQLFLSRYYESVEKTEQIKHKLMQALYQ